MAGARGRKSDSAGPQGGAGGRRSDVRRQLKPRISEIEKRSDEVRRVAGRRQADAIHKLRVAFRRAAAVCRESWWPGAEDEAKKLRKLLKRMRAAAGVVRDYDVLIHLLSECKADGVEETAGKRAALRRWREARGEAAEGLLTALADDLDRKLRRRFGALTESVHGGGTEGKSKASATASEVARLAREMRSVGKADLAELANLHALRIAGKHLRYALEIETSVVKSSPHGGALKALEKLQAELGSLNDIHNLITALDALRAGPKEGQEGEEKPKAGAAPMSGRALRGLQQLSHRLRGKRDAMHGRCLSAWEKFAESGSLNGLIAAPVAVTPAASIGESGGGAGGSAAREEIARAAQATVVVPRMRTERPRIAAIDIGSNSTRLIIAEVTPDAGYRVLDDEKEMTRLGRGLASGNRLDAEAIENTVATVARMRAIAEGYGVERLSVVLTAAGREASNGQELVRRLREVTGAEPRVISGRAEALLAYRSAARAFDLSRTPAVVVDIGGGSVEIVLSAATAGATPGRLSAESAGAPGRGRKREEESRFGEPGYSNGNSEGGIIERVYTLPLGAVRLTELFGGAEASSTDRFKELNRHVKRALEREVGEPPTAPQVLIGTGGTFSTLGAISLHAQLGSAAEGLFSGTAQGCSVKRPEVKHALDTLRKMPVDQRTNIPGLTSDRADIMVAGLAVVDRCMKHFGVNQTLVHEGGIRGGLLLEMVEQMTATGGAGTSGRRGSTTRRDPMKAVRRFARACGYEHQHSKHVAMLSLELFDQLVAARAGAAEPGEAETAPSGEEGAHSVFSPRSRTLLEAAALLHDVGYLVNYSAHHKHSYHLIINADLPGLTTSEIAVVANVARYHRLSEPKRRHPNFARLSKEDRGLVRSLAGILRVADGLDRTHAQHVTGIRMEMVGTECVLHVAASGDATVDIWGASRKAGLFEKCFGMALRIEREPSSGAEVKVGRELAGAGRGKKQVG